MKTWSFYDPATGLFSGRQFAGSTSFLAANTPEGLAAIEGCFDHRSQRIDVERLRADRAAALDRHRQAVETKRAAFQPRDALDVFAEPVFTFDATSEHVVDWQPPSPSADHEWNADAKRWVLMQGVVERQARRDAALAQIEALEAKGIRPQRELTLDPTNADAREQLASIDRQIAQLRAVLG